MKPLRALIREYRHLALALLLVAFFIRAIIPAGFMVSTASDTVLSVTICSDASAGLKQMQLVIPGKKPASGHSDGMEKAQHCAFSGLAKAAGGAGDPPGQVEIEQKVLPQLLARRQLMGGDHRA